MKQVTFIPFILVLIILQACGLKFEYFDHDLKACRKKKAAYYREIQYDGSGRPVGKVRDYYISGVLEFEGALHTVKPDTLDGLCIWYYANGQKSHEAIYNKGELKGEMRHWSKTGKEEGVLDSTGLFYSPDFLKEQIKEVGEMVEQQVGIDTATLTSFQNWGVALLNKGNYDFGDLLFRLSHDLAIRFNDKKKLARSYSNIGAVYQLRGQNNEALEFHFKAEEIQRFQQYESDLSISLNNIGAVYYVQGHLDQALRFYWQANEILEGRNQSFDLAISYNNIGALYESKGQLGKAILYYNKSKELREFLGEEAELAKVLNNIGLLNRKQGKWNQALELFLKANEIFERREMPVPLSKSFNSIGSIYELQGILDLALDNFQKAEEIQTRLQLEVDLAYTYSNIGSVYQTQGKTDKALLLFQKAKDIREKFELEVDAAYSYDDIGNLYISLGQLEWGFMYFQKAKNIREKLQIEAELLNSYDNYGSFYFSKGQFDQAIFYYKKSALIQERSGMQVELAKSYNSIGLVCKKLGLLDQALQYYSKAIDIQNQYKLELGLANSYNNLGGLYESQAQYQQAIKFFQNALDIQKRLGLENYMAVTLINLGNVYQSLEQWPQALENYQNAEEILERLRLEVKLATAFNNIGLTYLEQKDSDKALSYFQKARTIQERYNLKVDLALTYHNIGGVYDSRQVFDQAIIFYKKAKQIREALKLEASLFLSYNNLCVLYFSNSQLDSALHYALKNIELNDGLRKLNRGTFNRYSYVRKSLTTIEYGLISAYTLKLPEITFLISEKSKSRELVDLLAESSVRLPNNSALKKDCKNIENQLTMLNQSLGQEISDITRTNLGILIDSLHFQLKQTKDQIKLIDPDYAQLIYPETASLEKTQSVLSEEEVMISFFSGQELTFAFVIQADTMVMFNLGISDSLHQIVDSFRLEFTEKTKLALTQNNFLLKKISNNAFSSLSYNLYQKLWRPLEKTGLLNDKKILLIPDGYLNYLPFELLIKDDAQKPYSDYNYLIKEYPITYYPAATVLHFERTKKKNPSNWNKSFLGLALSEFSTNFCKVQSGTPEQLPLSALEVSNIANHFDTGTADILINDQATESAFKALTLSNYRYIHFSTHGLINSEKPDFSHLLLHPSEQEDGCLNLYEIFDQQWNADLVTLSACETGLGQLLKGEGMVGFTRALMYVGTPSVILSLWEVSDQYTHDLFINYYSALSANNKDKYIPLREAQLQMIQKGGEYANPFYWAPFVFIGERFSSGIE